MTKILDFTIIFLLVVAIIYGFILNRKIVLIQNSKKELANLFKSFDNTILKAQIGIDELKKVSNDAANLLQQKLDKAAFVIDDLSFLSEKAVEISSSIEKRVSASKKINNTTEKTYSPEIIRNIKQSTEVQKTRTAAIAQTDTPTNSRKAKILEGLLEKISEKRNSKEKISNDNSNLYQSSEKKQKDKSEEKTVADMLKAMGYGE